VLAVLAAHLQMEQAGLTLRLWVSQQLLLLVAVAVAGLMLLGQMVVLVVVLEQDFLVLEQVVQELLGKAMLVEHLSQIRQPLIALLVEVALVLLV
jgi:hypothetical protein